MHSLFQPREITLASGRKFTFIYDSSGGLEQIMLPRGARHTFRLQQSFHNVKVFHKVPGNNDPYITYWDLEGKVLQIRPPTSQGIIIYRYNQHKKISSITAGDKKTNFRYDNFLMLKEIVHETGLVILKTTMQHLQGLLVDVKVNFNAKSAFADAKFSYDYTKHLI